MRKATSQESAEVDTLVDAIASARLSEWLKSAEASRAIIDWVAKETRLPALVVRVFYHWLLLVAVEKIEGAVGDALVAGAKTARDRLLKWGRLPVFRNVLPVLKSAYAKAEAAKSREDRLRLFLGEEFGHPGIFNYAALEKEAFIRELDDNRAFRDSVTDDVTSILDELQRQPPLDLTEARGEESRFIYRSHGVHFCGRDTERAKLNAFLNATAMFRWWLITGAGGIGKSRLAFEFMLGVGGMWRCGFLPSMHGFQEYWHVWKPQFPTLMVVDYAGNRAKEAGNIVEALHIRADELKSPVRLLLLERDKNDHWWRGFVDNNTRWHTHFQPSQFDEPYQLQTLHPEALLDIMTEGRDQEGSDRAADLAGAIMLQADASPLMGYLERIDPFKRPLFAAFIGDAVRAGKDPANWDKLALLNDVQQRNEEKFWPHDVSPEERDLLLVATISNRLPWREVTNRCFANLLPEPNSGVAQRLGLMVGRTLDDAALPLEPDILGEFFVLQRLADHARFGTRGKQLVDAARWYAPHQCADFCRRAVNDFRGYPALADLFSADRIADNDMSSWSLIAEQAISGLLRSGYAEHAERLIDQLYDRSGRFETTSTEAKREHYTIICRVADDLIGFYGSANIEKAAAAWERLRSLPVPADASEEEIAALAGWTLEYTPKSRTLRPGSAARQLLVEMAKVPVIDRLVVPGLTLMGLYVQVKNWPKADALHGTLQEIVKGLPADSFGRSFFERTSSPKELAEEERQEAEILRNLQDAQDRGLKLRALALSLALVNLNFDLLRGDLSGASTRFIDLVQIGQGLPIDPEHDGILAQSALSIVKQLALAGNTEELLLILKTWVSLTSIERVTLQVQDHLRDDDRSREELFGFLRLVTDGPTRALVPPGRTAGDLQMEPANKGEEAFALRPVGEAGTHAHPSPPSLIADLGQSCWKHLKKARRIFLRIFWGHSAD